MDYVKVYGLETKYYLKVYGLETINYLEDNMLSFSDNQIIFVPPYFERRYVNVPIMVSTSYISYSSTLQFSIKVIGKESRDEQSTGVFETGEPLTLTRF